MKVIYPSKISWWLILFIGVVIIFSAHTLYNQEANFLEYLPLLAVAIFVLYAFTSTNYTIENIELLLLDENVVFIDVRDEWEQPRVPELNAMEITLDELSEAIDSIPRDKKVIVFCQTSGRSQQVVFYLTNQHGFTNLHSLEGGIMNYIHK